MSLSSSQRQVSYYLALAAIMALAASGCGPGKGSVSGDVTINNQPLPYGTITFIGESGDKQSKSADIVDGKYSLPDLQAGPVKVTVVTLPPATPGAAPGGAPAPQQAAPTGKYVPINQKYSNPETSGLSYEVKAGAQTKNFEVTP